MSEKISIDLIANNLPTSLEDLLAIIVFSLMPLALDLIYIFIIYKKQYNMINEIQNEVTPKLRYGYAVPVYIIIGLILYTMYKRNFSTFEVFTMGLLFYGFYNFTLLTLFEKADFVLAFYDCLWGSIMFTLVYVFVQIMHFIFFNKQKSSVD